MKIWWHHNRKDDEEIRALSRKIRFKWNNINLFIRCRKANNDWDHLIWLLPSIYLFFYFNGIDFIRCIINMYRIKGLCRAGSQSEGSKKYRIHALQNGHIQIYYDSNIQAANKFEFSNLKLEHLMLTIVKRKENNTIFHQMGWQVGSRIFGVWVDFNVIPSQQKGVLEITPSMQAFWLDPTNHSYLQTTTAVHMNIHSRGPAMSRMARLLVTCNRLDLLFPILIMLFPNQLQIMLLFFFVSIWNLGARLHFNWIDVDGGENFNRTCISEWCEEFQLQG